MSRVRAFCKNGTSLKSVTAEPAKLVTQRGRIVNYYDLQKVNNIYYKPQVCSPIPPLVSYSEE